MVQILAWREEALEQEGLGVTAGPSQGLGVTAGPAGRPGVVLSFEQQKVLHKKHFDAWLESPEQKEKVERVSKRHRGVRSRMVRDFHSMYRTACWESLGGTD